jgi:hypothetical protein
MQSFNGLTTKRRTSKRCLARQPQPSLYHKSAGSRAEPPNVRDEENQQPVSQVVEKLVKPPRRVD